MKVGKKNNIVTEIAVSKKGRYRIIERISSPPFIGFSVEDHGIDRMSFYMSVSRIFVILYDIIGLRSIQIRYVN
jgi:hypothetical protein